jgi:hypothetical protein
LRLNKPPIALASLKQAMGAAFVGVYCVTYLLRRWPNL